MILIEAPTQIQQRLSIPKDHYDVCQAAGVPSAGNAAANTKDFLDLKGQNKQQPFLPAGFTARGIVAMVFSCLSGVIGILFIVVYGLSDLRFHHREESAEVVMVMENLPKKGANVTTDESYKD